jgi:hypothetical protein
MLLEISRSQGITIRQEGSIRERKSKLPIPKQVKGANYAFLG